MSNLKDIKQRIQSVKSTQKITKAMKMVAAAKVKKAEITVKSSRPFTEELLGMFKRMLAKVEGLNSDTENFEHSIDNYPKLLESREVKVEGILVVTSNKGLAGAYNANIVRVVQKRISENDRAGIATKLYIVGQKGISALQNKSNVEITKQYISEIDNPTSSDAGTIAEDLADDFVNGIIDKIVIVTTRFNNMMSYSVQNWQVLPIDIDYNVSEHSLNPIMEFSPSPKVILEKIVPIYIKNEIFQALLEAYASELASRLTSMSAATNNAENMISELTVSYNKARQSDITDEIIEIVAGASAQK